MVGRVRRSQEDVQGSGRLGVGDSRGQPRGFPTRGWGHWVGGQGLLRRSGRCGCKGRLDPTLKSPACQERHRLDLEGDREPSGPMSWGDLDQCRAADGQLQPQ